MSKLYFYYSAMNAGKSTVLLQSSYNYRERGMDTLLFTPDIDNRYGVGKITSRIGLDCEAILFNQTFNFYTAVTNALELNSNIHCILLDEAQFLSREQVLQLTDVADKLNRPVLAYGLRTDFRGELFEGSQYLLAWADELIEIKTICHCGRKATMVVRVDEQLRPVHDGPQIVIGGNLRYISTCRKHFKLGQIARVPKSASTIVTETA